MIEQLLSITHVNGHVVQPSAITQLESTDDWSPSLLEIGFEADAVHICAETASADALVASVVSVLSDRFLVGEPQAIIDRCVSLSISLISNKPQPGGRDADPN